MIPIQYYAAIYYNILLLFCLILYFQSISAELQDTTNLNSKEYLGKTLLVFVILYMGLRPISFVFADMGVYNVIYNDYINGAPVDTEKDVAFNIFMKFCSNLFSARIFFLLCAFIYVYSHYLVSKKFFGDYWFYSFVILVFSMSFWAYGSNGIRNGLATALFLIALSRKNILFQVMFVLLSIAIHKSLIIPTAALILATVYFNTKHYLFFWFLCIPLSIALGSFWENFFFSLGIIEQDRLAGYLTGDDAVLDNLVQLKVGFRWDFLIYSATGVFAGWYYIFKKKFEDKTYNKLFNIYLTANAFWILVIRANFSNRFAYLSWFLLGLIIIYPLLKNIIFKKQHKIVASIIFVYFMFSYILNFILKSV